MAGLNQVQQNLVEVSNPIKEQIQGLGTKLEEVQKQVDEVKQETLGLAKDY